MNEPDASDPDPLDHWEIRPANHADASAIARIYNHYVDAGGSTFDTVHWTIDQTIKYLQSPLPDHWVVAQGIQDVLGWASARLFSLRTGYCRSMESAIYLNPDGMGRGVADELQRTIEEHCRQHQIHHLVAKIVADNQRSMAFHYRHGYQLVGVQNEIGFLNDQWLDVAILQKLL